jgi:serpin B
MPISEEIAVLPRLLRKCRFPANSPKHLFQRIIVVALFTYGICCGSAIATASNSPSEEKTAQSVTERDMHPKVSDADFSVMISSNIKFALAALPLLDSGANTNMVFSPYSMTRVVALAAAGARGNTLEGIRRAMSFSLPQERLNSAFNKFSLMLASEASSANLPKSQLPNLNVSDAIWGQLGGQVSKQYLDTIAANFGAGLHLLDFAHHPDASRLAINDWVENETEGRIKQLIALNGISDGTRLVLTNTVWFKAEWRTKFHANSTSDQPFIGRSGNGVSVPFMHGTMSIPYADVDGCLAVDIPYSGDQISMLIVMPDVGTFDAFLSALTPEKYTDITAHLKAANVLLSWPKFKFDTASDLKQPLRMLGMTDAFQSQLADFSGIDGQHDLFIDSVMHKAFIEVNENGTEASAATAVVVAKPTFTRFVHLRLTVDHPFIFLLRDVRSGMILFVGKVVSL